MESRRPEAVLVVGSFPPVPTPGAAATVAAVRRELRAGHTVVTASPRPSAASRVLRLSGPLGAWELERLRRHVGAVELDLSLEPGWSLPPGISLVLRRFARVRLLVSDATPSSIGVLQRMSRGADAVVLSDGAARADAVATIARAVPGVTLRVDDAPPLGRPLDGITPLGPTEAEGPPAGVRVPARARRVVRALRHPRRSLVQLEQRSALFRRFGHALRAARRATSPDP